VRSELLRVPDGVAAARRWTRGKPRSVDAVELSRYTDSV